eukprot:m.202398 g.202398  ORF g.202398 m.202398 type:complete len:211 (+) comp53836_c0_seq2:2-634(+)
MDEKELRRIWRARMTLRKMCYDRGYLVIESELQESIENFLDANPALAQGIVSREALSFVVKHYTDPTDQLIVFFPDESTISTDTVNAFGRKMSGESIHHGIIVIKDKISPIAEKSISEAFVQARLRIELFSELELQFNVTDHSLVPKHSVLSEEEKVALLGRYLLSEEHLPRIQAGDPIARYFGVQRGQVLKIIRPSDTAGRYVTYRLVY